MANTKIDIAELVALFGKYYRPGGSRRQLLQKWPYEKFGTKQALTLLPVEGNIVELGITEQEEIIQAYQDDYTPKGGVTIKPKMLILDQVKIDQKFNPSKLLKSWAAFLANRDNGKSYDVNRAAWPFIVWFIEEYLMKQADDDLEKKVVYKGERSEPVAGTAGATVNATTGIKKRINDGIAASDIEPILTGALADDPVDFVEQIEAFAKSIPEEYWDKVFALNMNRTNVLKYKEGRKKKYNMYYAQESDLAKVSNFDGITVAGRASMQGSNKIWGTLPGNFILAVQGFQNKDLFEIEKAERFVSIYTDWFMATDYILGNQVFTNDLELT